MLMPWIQWTSMPQAVHSKTNSLGVQARSLSRFTRGRN